MSVWILAAPSPTLSSWMPRGCERGTKVSSTTDDFAQGIVQGLDTLISSTNAACEDIREVIHATTIATNAILEAKGAPTGLITTAGFRDVLEIRRLRMPRLYDLHWEPPKPLVPRGTATGSRRAHGHSGKHCV